MVSDPDGTPSDRLNYRLGTSPGTLRVSLSGCTLSVELPEPQPQGPAGAIEVKVDDGEGAVSGSVPVNVVASTRPPIQVSDAVVATARPGVTETIDLNRYAINPFPGEPLTVIGSPTIVRGHGTVDVQGTTMHVTPSADMLGTLNITYTLGDATGDPSRHVTANVRLTVRDKPEPPRNVSANVIGPGSAVVKFTAGDNNGAPITEFRVTSRSGVTTNCTTSECLVSGLENGSEHEFQVVAVNEIGASEASGWSAPVLVDVQPGKPAPPALKPGDRSIDVRITPTESLGSPVKEYIVTLHPGGAKQRVPAGGSLETSFTGLSNGTSYRASVQAFNSSGKPSESSDLSTEAIPFGKPAPVTDVAIKATSTNNTHATAAISWKYGSGNGRDVRGAVIELSDGQRFTVDSSRTSISPRVQLGETVTATVTQVTEYGESDPVVSRKLTPYSVPAKPKPGTVTVTGPEEVTIEGATANAGGGFDPARLTLEVYDPAQGWVRYRDGARLKGFTIGQPATVQVRAVGNEAGSGTRHSEAATATSRSNVYGMPFDPTVEASASATQVTFTYSVQASANGRTISHLEMRSPGQARIEEELRGSLTRIDGQPGERIEREFRACYDDGDCSGWVRASADIPPKYEFTFTACQEGDLGPVDPDSTEPPEPCQRVELVYTDASAGQRVTCTFTDPIHGQQTSKRFRPGTVSGHVGLITSYTSVTQLNSAVDNNKFTCG